MFVWFTSNHKKIMNQHEMEFSKKSRKTTKNLFWTPIFFIAVEHLKVWRDIFFNYYIIYYFHPFYWYFFGLDFLYSLHSFHLLIPSVNNETVQIWKRQKRTQNKWVCWIWAFGVSDQKKWPLIRQYFIYVPPEFSLKMHSFRPDEKMQNVCNMPQALLCLPWMHSPA